MFYWTILLLTIAIIAAIFGFASPAGGVAVTAQVLFFTFLVAAMASLIWQLAKKRQQT